MKKRQAMYMGSNAKEPDAILFKKFRYSEKNSYSPCNNSLPDSPQSLNSREVTNRCFPPSPVLPDSPASVASKDLNERQELELSREYDYPVSSPNTPGCSSLAQDLSIDCRSSPRDESEANLLGCPSQKDSGKLAHDMKTMYHLSSRSRNPNEKLTQGISRQHNSSIPTTSHDVPAQSVIFHQFSRDNSLPEVALNLHCSRPQENAGNPDEYFTSDFPLNLTSKDIYGVHYVPDSSTYHYSRNLDSDFLIPINVNQKEVLARLNQHILKDSDNAIDVPNVPVNAVYQERYQKIDQAQYNRHYMTLVNENVLDKVEKGAYASENQTKYSSDDLSYKMTLGLTQFSILDMCPDDIPKIPDEESNKADCFPSKVPPVSCTSFSQENRENPVLNIFKTMPPICNSKEPNNYLSNGCHVSMGPAAFNFPGTSTSFAESSEKLDQNLSKECPLNLALNQSMPKECVTYLDNVNPNSLSDETVQEESSRKVQSILSNFEKESLSENDVAMFPPNEHICVTASKELDQHTSNKDNHHFSNVPLPFPCNSISDPTYSLQKQDTTNHDSLSDETVHEESSREVKSILSNFGKDSSSENDVMVPLNEPICETSIKPSKELNEHSSDTEDYDVSNVPQQISCNSLHNKLEIHIPPNEPCISTSRQEHSIISPNKEKGHDDSASLQFPDNSMHNNSEIYIMPYEPRLTSSQEPLKELDQHLSSEEDSHASNVSLQSPDNSIKSSSEIRISFNKLCLTSEEQSKELDQHLPNEVDMHVSNASLQFSENSLQNNSEVYVSHNELSSNSSQEHSKELNQLLSSEEDNVRNDTLRFPGLSFQNSSETHFPFNKLSSTSREHSKELDHQLSNRTDNHVSNVSLQFQNNFTQNSSEVYIKPIESISISSQEQSKQLDQQFSSKEDNNVSHDSLQFSNNSFENSSKVSVTPNESSSTSSQEQSKELDKQFSSKEDNSNSHDSFQISNNSFENSPKAYVAPNESSSTSSQEQSKELDQQFSSKEDNSNSHDSLQISNNSFEHSPKAYVAPNESSSTSSQEQSKELDQQFSSKEDNSNSHDSLQFSNNSFENSSKVSVTPNESSSTSSQEQSKELDKQFSSKEDNSNSHDSFQISNNSFENSPKAYVAPNESSSTSSQEQSKELDQQFSSKEDNSNSHDSLQFSNNSFENSPKVSVTQNESSSTSSLEQSKELDQQFLSKEDNSNSHDSLQFFNNSFENTPKVSVTQNESTSTSSQEQSKELDQQFSSKEDNSNSHDYLQFSKNSIENCPEVYVKPNERTSSPKHSKEPDQHLSSEEDNSVSNDILQFSENSTENIYVKPNEPSTFSPEHTKELDQHLSSEEDNSVSNDSFQFSEDSIENSPEVYVKPNEPSTSSPEHSKELDQHLSSKEGNNVSNAPLQFPGYYLKNSSETHIPSNVPLTSSQEHSKELDQHLSYQEINHVSNISVPFPDNSQIYITSNEHCSTSSEEHLKELDPHISSKEDNHGRDDPLQFPGNSLQNCSEMHIPANELCSTSSQECSKELDLDISNKEEDHVMNVSPQLTDNFTQDNSEICIPPNEPCATSSNELEEYSSNHNSNQVPTICYQNYMNQDGTVFKIIPCFVDLSINNLLANSLLKPDQELPNPSQPIVTSTVSAIQKCLMPLAGKNQTLSGLEISCDAPIDRSLSELQISEELGENHQLQNVPKKYSRLSKEIIMAQSPSHKEFTVHFSQNYIFHYIKKGYAAMSNNKTVDWRKVYNRYFYSPFSTLSYNKFVKIVDWAIKRHKMCLKLLSLRHRVRLILDQKEAAFRTKRKIYYHRDSYILAENKDYVKYVEYVRNVRLCTVKVNDLRHVYYEKDCCVRVDAGSAIDARIAVRNAKRCKVALHALDLRI